MEQFVGNKGRGKSPCLHEYSKDVLIVYGIVRGSVSGGPDSNAVDFHAAIQFDDEALSAVDHFSVYQICALGIDLDDHIRGLYFKAAGIVDIGHHQGSIFSVSISQVLPSVSSTSVWKVSF